MRTKHAIHIMVFEVVTSDSDFMSLSNFPNGLRLYVEAYIKYLEEIVLPWIERVTTGRPYQATELCAMPHKQENPVVADMKFLLSHHL